MSTPHTEIPNPDTGTTTPSSVSIPAIPQNTATGYTGLGANILNAVSDFVGVMIGFGFVTIGIIILIQSSKKVQDVQRKVVSGAAAAVPQLAGAAVAAHAFSGKSPTAEHVGQAIKNTQPKPVVKPKAIPVVKVAPVVKTPVVKAAPKSKFSVPNVPDKTRLIKEPTYSEKLPSSPRAERNFD